MSFYQVTVGKTLWCETSNLVEAEELYDEALYNYPDQRIVLSRWYEPPAPVGHWIDEKSAQGLTPAKE